MVHQDLKPENIMIDRYGTVKIIDLGSTRIAGIEEISTPLEKNNLLGTRNYTAPECLLGMQSNNVSDIYSLGVIAYELLTGRLPYGRQELTASRLRRVRYQPARHVNPDIPLWIDRALEKATAIERRRRYQLMSEFVHDLAHPNADFNSASSEPLIERNPLLVWKGIAGVLLLINLVLLFLLAQ